MIPHRKKGTTNKQHIANLTSTINMLLETNNKLSNAIVELQANINCVHFSVLEEKDKRINKHPQQLAMF